MAIGEYLSISLKEKLNLGLKEVMSNNLSPP